MTVGSWVRGKRSVAIQHSQVVDSSHWSQMVAIAPTAYNFLGVTRDAAQSARDGHDSTNAVSLLRFDSAQEASAAYALLSSRFAFWLWHVTGDGFHTSGKLPWYVPAPSETDAVERLANLGEELWQLASKSPTVSRNRGGRPCPTRPGCTATPWRGSIAKLTRFLEPRWPIVSRFGMRN